MVTPYQVKAAYEQVQRMGFLDPITPWHLFLEIDVDDVKSVLPEFFSESQFQYAIDRYMRKLVEYFSLGFGAIKILMVTITERCTLKCKECMNLMPYYKNPRHYDWVDIKKAIDRLFEVTAFDEICMEGGEAFLHPNIADFLEYLIDSPKVKRITPITNGTMLPDERTLNALSHPKVSVRISNYKEHSAKLEELKTLFDQRGVDYFVMLQRWYKCAGVNFYDRTPEQLQDLYVNCCKSDGTPFLWNGRLYKCQFAASTNQLGVIPNATEGSIDLLSDSLNPEELKEQVDAFFTRENPIDACNYCAGRGYHTELIPIAEQLIGEAPELPRYTR